MQLDLQVLEGQELLSPRTPVEEQKLRGKPATWRLACQTLVGDGENTGRIKVKTQPKK
jgi:ferredoxin